MPSLMAVQSIPDARDEALTRSAISIAAIRIRRIARDRIVGLVAPRLAPAVL